MQLYLGLHRGLDTVLGQGPDSSYYNEEDASPRSRRSLRHVPEFFQPRAQTARNADNKTFTRRGALSGPSIWTESVSAQCTHGRWCGCVEPYVGWTVPLLLPNLIALTNFVCSCLGNSELPAWYSRLSRDSLLIDSVAEGLDRLVVP